MKKRFFFLPYYCLLWLLWLFILAAPRIQAQIQGRVIELKSIDFKQKNEISTLELTFDANEMQFNKFNVIEDKQIIIDFKNVRASERVGRGFDTSEFSGGVVYVSLYKKPGTDNDLRLALQLRDNVRSIIERGKNRLFLRIENRFGVFSEREISQGKIKKDVQSGRDYTAYRIPKSNSVEDILHNLTLSGKKKYIGKKISFNVKDASIEDILSLIAHSSGFNIILTEEVKKLPRLSLNLVNVPWDQALDTILGINKLVAEKNGGILTLTTLAKATEDKKAELQARSLAEVEKAQVTKIFPISYAEIKDINKIISSYITKKKGAISIDERTNALILRDYPDVIEKVKGIIEILDTQTPQVLIESKIVEVSEEYSQEIGLQNGVNFGYDPVGQVSSAKGSIGSKGGGPGNSGPGFTFSSAPNTGEEARNIFGLAIGNFGRLFNLNFNLQLMENESKGKVISSPKVITQNKKKAEIRTQDTRSYSVTSGVGDNIQTGFENAVAELVLEVTPQVTNEGSIALDINLSKEQFGAAPAKGAPPNKQSRNLSTSVLVDNGSTIVIGGIYSYENRESHSGVPFLKDLPLVGWLFRSAYNPSVLKNEMIIFLTPRVINQEEAGLVENAT